MDGTFGTVERPMTHRHVSDGWRRPLQLAKSYTPYSGSRSSLISAAPRLAEKRNPDGHVPMHFRCPLL